MSVDRPTDIQIVVAWRGARWLVSRNTVEVGAYAYRNHAMDRARGIIAEARAAGAGCYLLVRERDGAWHERPGRRA